MSFSKTILPFLCVLRNGPIKIIAVRTLGLFGRKNQGLEFSIVVFKFQIVLELDRRLFVVVETLFLFHGFHQALKRALDRKELFFEFQSNTIEFLLLLLKELVIAYSIFYEFHFYEK